MLALAEQLGEEARGAALADRVMGKAAAMVARSMGVASVYALLVSEPARETLVRGGVPLECEQLVPTILNEKGDGPCPLERLVAAIEDPEEAVRVLRSFLRCERFTLGTYRGVKRGLELRKRAEKGDFACP